MKLLRKTLAAAAALLATTAYADVNIGVTLSLTGPASGLGIPAGNQFKLFPKQIAGEKINLIVLDDASDPGKGVTNARRFVTEDKVDILFGGSITVVSAAIAPIALESKTPQLSIAPVGVPPDQERWMFRLPQGFAVMAHPIVQHMKKHGVKTVGFLGYTDAYGELWLKEFTKQGEAAGIKVAAVERFARTDTSATPQALKLVTARPDAMLVVASGSGAAMPHKALVERGFKGKIYQTHAAATPDLVRIGGKDVEGSYVVSGPAVIAEQLPDNHPSKAADRLRHQVRGRGRPRPAQPVRRPRLRHPDRDGEGPAGRAAEGKARHARVPRRAARCDRDHGPHHPRPRRDELDRGRPLGLYERDRRHAPRGGWQVRGREVIWPAATHSTAPDPASPRRAPSGPAA